MSEEKKPHKDFGFGSKLNSDKNDPNKKPKFNITWVYGALAIALFSMFFLDFGNKPIEITWNRFEQQMLKAHDVEKIVVVTNQSRAEIYIKQDRLEDPKYSELKNTSNSISPTGPQYFFTIGSIEVFRKPLR